MRSQLVVVLSGIALLGVNAAAARAQYMPNGTGFGQPFGSAGYGPMGPSGMYAPNFYNRQNQPLSPYLNLLRGTNPAVNYFYGARPGTMAGSFPGNYGWGGNFGMQRQTFFPYVDTLSELDEEQKGPGMAPTGHPTGFNNTLGYYGMPQTGFGMGRGAQQQLPGQQGGQGTGRRGGSGRR